MNEGNEIAVEDAIGVLVSPPCIFSYIFFIRQQLISGKQSSSSWVVSSYHLWTLLKRREFYVIMHKSSEKGTKSG